MIYLMSDIHGRYDEYKELLRIINFKDSDTLFVLGDMVDRGEQSMELLLDMMYRANVYPIAGNHDLIALACLKEMAKEITEETIADLDLGTMDMMLDWLNNLGGQATMKSFQKLDIEDREAVLEYLEDLEMYDEITLDDTEYILVHTLGLEHFHPDKEMDEYTAEDLLDTRCDYGVIYYPNKILVTGHTPTVFIKENQSADTIYKGKNHIAIDCSMRHLGCICLDTMKEYYSSKK